MVEKLQSPPTAQAVNVLPSIPDGAAAALIKKVELAVRRVSGGRVHKVRVELGRGEMILRGFCSTFYAKQLAQHAAMPLAEGRRLKNEIEVW